MDNKEFGKLFEKRTEDFSILIIKLSASLPNDIESKILKNQLTKSGTSIGANYREANRARSNADFKNKIRICESEASETIYWLTLIHRMGWETGEMFNTIRKEANEILAILASISKNMNSK